MGDKVLVLIPTAESKFLATWHGLYKVIEMLEPVTAAGETETNIFTT